MILFWLGVGSGVIGFLIAMSEVVLESKVFKPRLGRLQFVEHEFDATIIHQSALAFPEFRGAELWRLLSPVLVRATVYVGPIFLLSGYLFGDGMLGLGKVLLGLLAGVALSVFPGLQLGLRKGLQNRRARKAKPWIGLLGTLKDKSIATAMLLRAARHPEEPIRMAAIEGLREMNNPECSDALHALTKDQDTAVRLAATKVWEQRCKVLAAPHPMSLAQLPSIIANHQKLVAGANPSGKNPAYSRPQLLAITEALIEEIVYSQFPLRGKFPHVFCRDCWARCEPQFYDRWVWMRCIRCEDAVAIQGDVARVIGVVGADEEWQMQGTTLRISLWDAVRQQARNGQIAVLEIVGGRDLNYDWAVSAVVEKLRNANHDFGKLIAVKLVGNPPLSHNTHQLLHDLDPKYKVAPKS